MDHKTDAIDEVRKLSQESPELGEVMEAYREAERVYQDALIAMGRTGQRESLPSNAAQVTISVPTAVSRERW
jgi:hypothetical protein